MFSVYVHDIFVDFLSASEGNCYQFHCGILFLSMGSLDPKFQYCKCITVCLSVYHTFSLRAQLYNRSSYDGVSACECDNLIVMCNNLSIISPILVFGLFMGPTFKVAEVNFVYQLVNTITCEIIDPASPTSICGFFMGRSRMSLYLGHFQVYPEGPGGVL